MMKKHLNLFVSLISAFAFSCLVLSTPAESYNYKGYYVSDVTHMESCEFNAILRSQGNYKTVKVHADMASHTDGSMDISLTCDDISQLSVSWQLLMQFEIPSDYDVKFYEGFTLQRDFAIMDDSIVFYGDDGLDTNTIAHIRIFPNDTIKENAYITVEGQSFLIYSDYDEECRKIANTQIQEIDRIINNGYGKTISNNYSDRYDVNADGLVTISDATLILRYITEM